MKLSLLIGGAVGYLLGTRAGRERYESLVRLGRAVAGSEPVRSAAVALQAQLGDAGQRTRQSVLTRLREAAATAGVNGRAGS